MVAKRQKPPLFRGAQEVGDLLAHDTVSPLARFPLRRLQPQPEFVGDVPYNSAKEHTMAASERLPTIAGSHGAYQWITTGLHDLDTLLLACPNVFLGKYLAVTSFDSGALSLSDQEMSVGWRSHGGIAYSPRVQSVEKLPHGDCGGFDEWYVFQNLVDLGQVARGNLFQTPLTSGQLHIFVNFGAFGVHDLTSYLTDRFWAQLGWVNPESYVADGDYLNFVSRDKHLFDAVHQALSTADRNS
jgi:hypothetical protein